jgi:hypothetical protein
MWQSDTNMPQLKGTLCFCHANYLFRYLYQPVANPCRRGDYGKRRNVDEGCVLTAMAVRYS